MPVTQHRILARETGRVRGKEEDGGTRKNRGGKKHEGRKSDTILKMEGQQRGNKQAETERERGMKQLRENNNTNTK